MPIVFDFSKTPLRAALAVESFYPSFARGVIPAGLWFVALLCAAGGVWVMPRPFLGLMFLVAAGAVPLTLLALFFDHALAVPHIALSLRQAFTKIKEGATVNAAPYVSFAAAKMLARARGQPGRFLAHFLSTPRGQFMLSRLNVNRAEFIAAFRAKPGNPQELGAALSAAALHAEHRGHLRIEMPDMLVALAEEYPVFKNLLFAKEVSKDDIETIAHWEDRMYHDRLRQKKFWRKDAILSVPPLGRDWAAGYSITLDRYSHELGRGRLGGSATLPPIGGMKGRERFLRAPDPPGGDHS